MVYTVYESHVHVNFIVLWCVCTVQVCDQKLVLVARGAGGVDRGVRNALESHDGSPEGGKKFVAVPKRIAIGTVPGPVPAPAPVHG